MAYENNRLENVIEGFVFSSRWIQAPLYGGLIIAQLLYAYKFTGELWELFRYFPTLTNTTFMLGILSLIDIALVANLLTVVVIGGGMRPL